MEEMNTNVIEEAVETTEAVENNAGSGLKTLVGIGLIAGAGVVAYKGIKKIVTKIKAKIAEKKNTEVIECEECVEITDSEDESK